MTDKSRTDKTDEWDFRERPDAPKTKWFPPEFRTASVVPRWSIVWTLTRDTLSNHSFFVSVYAYQIARMIGWDGDYGALMYTAVLHDADECVSGDIVAPAKRAMLDNERAKTYLREQMLLRMATVVEELDNFEARLGPRATSEIKRIVKAADRLDALLFLTVEKRMGNGVVAPRIPEVYEGLRQSWHDLPADQKSLAALWVEVKDAVTDHATSGGFGV